MKITMSEMNGTKNRLDIEDERLVNFSSIAIETRQNESHGEKKIKKVNRLLVSFGTTSSSPINVKLESLADREGRKIFEEIMAKKSSKI